MELDEQLAQLAADHQNWGSSFGNGFDAEIEGTTISKLAELMAMDLTDEPPSAKLKKLLDDIGVEENWKIQYIPMERPTKNGKFCCVQFAFPSTNLLVRKNYPFHIKKGKISV